MSLFFNELPERLNEDGIAKLMAGICFGEKMLANDAWLSSILDLLKKIKLSSIGYKHQCEAVFVHDARSRLHLIKAPTLIVGGSRDIIFIPEDQMELYHGIPNAQIKIFPGVGHACTFEIPADFSRTVIEFLLFPVTGKDSVLAALERAQKAEEELIVLRARAAKMELELGLCRK
ncbi:MAG: alpha/beta hydrolase [Alphaproteobacteria bacterium]|nr:alpha/beta hydrolase [Silvanigrellaceae bacterium]MBY0462535.1 alpha/beta hydrolase [Alphaproteobacteria bacterium]